MPSDATLKIMNAVHRSVIKITGGRQGWKAGTMPVLELTTIGRKSGVPHSVLLATPVQEGSTIVVVASRGGDDTHPAWFLNLRSNPDVQVRLAGGPTVPMLAREATAEERSRLWPGIAAGHRNYAGYQARTDREIPLVLLTPPA